jgi:serine/threonine-protein kinase RsbW/stage II sporulation protein AB (anti-sigma F factor)
VEPWQGTFPATARAAKAIRGEMGAVARRCGLSEQRVGDVELAVSEAATNVVVHAYRDSESGTVTAHASSSHGQLRIVISDHGAGMAPRMDSPGLGLGLPIIASVADRVEVRSPEKGGTEVHITFPCPAAGA